MLKIGEIFEGKYKIIKIIGTGHFGTVFLAVNIMTGKKWALKEVIKTNIGWEEMFQRELRALKGLHHKNLVSLSDIFETDDTYLFMTDYIEGMDLDRLVAEYSEKGLTGIPPPLACKIALQLCEALVYIQSKNMIHGDIKPSNVMVTPDMNVVLIDFGGAIVQERKEFICIGTAGYSPPEMSKGETDKTTDIYSFGALLHYLLTGDHPDLNSGFPLTAAMENKNNGSGKKESDFLLSLEKIIRKCTEVQKENRFESAEALLSALKKISGDTCSLKKRKAFKTVSFLITLFLIPLFGSISVYGGHMKNILREKVYDDCMSEASNYYGNNAADYYRLAIMLAPEEKTAYLKLIEALTLDNTISAEDDEMIMSAFASTEYDRAVSNEDNLRADNSAYVEVAYRTGMAYYFCFEDADKNTAYKYLSVVASADMNKVFLGENDSFKFEWQSISEDLVKIIRYKKKLGLPGIAGEQEVTYKDYYNDLLSVISKKPAGETSSLTRLWTIKDFIYAVYLYCDDFAESGIRPGDMKTELENLREILTEYTDSENLQTVRLLEETEKGLELAFSKIAAVTEEEYRKEVAG